MTLLGQICAAASSFWCLGRLFRSIPNPKATDSKLLFAAGGLAFLPLALIPAALAWKHGDLVLLSSSLVAVVLVEIFLKSVRE